MWEHEEDQFTMKPWNQTLEKKTKNTSSLEAPVFHASNISFYSKVAALEIKFVYLPKSTQQTFARTNVDFQQKPLWPFNTCANDFYQVWEAQSFQYMHML